MKHNTLTMAYGLKKLWMMPLLIFSLILPACSDDKDGDDPTPAVTECKVSSSSVAENEVIDYTTSTITLEYNSDIIVNNSAALSVTLNGDKVSSTVSGKVLTVNVSLTANTSYTLVVPQRYLLGKATSSFATEYTLHFSTADIPTVDTNFAELSNTSASQEAKNLYNYLISQNGKKVLSGAMANVNNNNDFADWIYKKTGKYPALTCYDFIHLCYSGQNWIDYSNITPAKTQWDNNGVVAYMWHWRVPKSQTDYENKNYDNYAYDGSFDIEAALTAGTWQNECINADIAKVAGYLKLLKDQNIPVLWRPLHEAAGDYSWGSWFWWGSKGTELTKRLWIYLYNKLTNEYGLNNLIWVWTAQTSDAGANASLAKIQAAYPGNEYVDIVGTDVYAENNDSHKDLYSLLLSMTEGKRMVTLAEVGRIPNPDTCIGQGANWSWFMLWYTNNIHTSSATEDGFGNSVSFLKKVMTSSYVINRDEMPSLK
jgi:mannan endo-1,4-beta-mannosidase